MLKKTAKATTLQGKALEKLLYEIRLLKVPDVLFAGDGEPFMLNKLPELIEAAKGIRVQVLTNGSRLERVSRKLFEQIDKLTISINSINDVSHKLIHGYDGESLLPVIMSQVERLLAFPAAGMKIQINYVATADNVGELEDVFRLSRDWGVYFAIRPMYVHNSNFEEKGLTSLQIEKARSLIIEELNKSESMPVHVRSSLRYALHSFQMQEANIMQDRMSPCYSGFYKGFVDSEGNYLMCPYNKKPLGNIYSRSFSEIWQEKSVQMAQYSAALMHEHNHPSCHACRTCPEKELYSKDFHRYLSLIPQQKQRVRDIYMKLCSETGSEYH